MHVLRPNQLIGSTIPDTNDSLDNDKLITTDLDSLFIEELELTTYDINVTEEDQLRIPDCPKTVQIQIGDPISKYILYQEEFSHEGAEQHKILHKLRTAVSGSKLEIHITSPGGSVMEGMNLIQILKESFKGNSTTYLEGFVASMGSMLFVCGDKRVCREDSYFMLHDFQYGIGGSGGIVVKQAEFYNKWLDPFFRRLLVYPGFITDKEFNDLKSNNEAYYGTEELVLRGIATHVSINGVELTGEEYLECVDTGFTVEEYLEYKEVEKEIADGSDIVTVNFEELLETLGLEFEEDKKFEKEDEYERFQN